MVLIEGLKCGRKCCATVLMVFATMIHVTLAQAESVVPRFAYLINAFDSTISVYTVDAKSGRLRNNGHAYTGKFPSQVVIHPNGKFAYATAQTGMTLSSFRIDQQTGRLTELKGSPLRTGVVSPGGLVILPSGRYLYVMGRNSHNIVGFSINPQTGIVTPLPGKYPTKGDVVRSIVMHPSGKFVYAVNPKTNTIMGYKVNQHDGSLDEIQGAPFTVGRGPQFMVFSHDGRFAYVTQWMEHTVHVYSVNVSSGALKPLDKGVFKTGRYPFFTTTDPAGHFLYVGNWVDNSIWVYRINAENGMLTPVPDSVAYATGNPVVSMAVTGDGRYLYATDYNTDNVSQFRIDPLTGKLSDQKLIGSRVGPRYMAILNGKAPVTYTPQTLYVVNDGDNSLQAFSIDAASGELSLTQTLKTQLHPSSVATTPDGQHIYVANKGANSLSSFSPNAKDGKLHEITGSPVKTGKSPQSVSVGDNGRYVYVSNWESNNLSAYEIDPNTGFPAPMKQSRLFTASPYPTHPHPGMISINPAGMFSYIANSDQNRATVFFYYEDSPLVERLDSPQLPFKFNDSPAMIRILPSTRYALVPNADSNKLSVYDIQSRNGNFSLNVLSPYPTGKKPVYVDVTPDERFIYVLDQGSEDIMLFELNMGKGSLKEILPRIKTGKHPAMLQVDANGKYLYVVNNGSNTIGQYGINQKTGQLSRIKMYSTGAKPVAITISTTIH